MTILELEEELRRLGELHPGGCFLLSGLDVTIMLVANGKPVNLELAKSSGYLVIMLGTLPDGIRAGVTALDV